MRSCSDCRYYAVNRDFDGGGPIVDAKKNPIIGWDNRPLYAGLCAANKSELVWSDGSNYQFPVTYDSPDSCAMFEETVWHKVEDKLPPENMYVRTKLEGESGQNVCTYHGGVWGSQDGYDTVANGGSFAPPTHWAFIGGEVKERWYKHTGRGTIYAVVGEAEVQASQPIKEGDKVTVYRGVDGRLWARSTAEFTDGRFRSLADLPPSETDKAAFPGVRDE